MANTVLPLTSCLVYWLAFKRRTAVASGPSIAGAMLIGIYVLGPSFLMLEQMLTGTGGFHDFSKWSDWVYLLVVSLLPPYVLMMSTYDASLYAVLAVTILLTVAHYHLEKGRWIVPIGRDRVGRPDAQ